MSEPIPVFRTHVPERARSRAAEVMARGWLGYGPECRSLESVFVEGRGGFALATSSCTSALYLAALLCRDADGATPPEVIVPSITFISTAMAFHHAGYRVRLAPADPAHLMITPDAVLPLLTASTRAVVAVHLYGQPCPEIARLRALCDERGLALIEDCAHRIDLLDAPARGGHYRCYSFNAVKELPCGEGGLLWGEDADAEALARGISNAGLGLDTMQRAASTRHADYAFTPLSGLKLRCNDLAASLVNGSLDDLGSWRERRRTQFALYDRLLSKLRPRVELLARGEDDACLMYVVRVPAAVREVVREGMARRNVATSVHYPSLAEHPLFHGSGQRSRGPDATLVTLPTYLEMTSQDQETVVAALAGALTEVQAVAPVAAFA